MDNKKFSMILGDALEKEIPSASVNLWPDIKANLVPGMKPVNQQETEHHSSRVRRPLRFALPAIAIAVFLVVFLLTPQGRALGQDLLHRIGNFIFSNEPSDAEVYVATMQSGTPTPTVDPNWVCTDCPEPVIVGMLTQTQASDKAGFPVYVPTYISEGYSLVDRDVLFTDSSTTAHASYSMELDPPLHDGQQMSGIIAITQTLVADDAAPWETGVGDVPIVDVVVRGQPGVWLEQLPIIPIQNEQGEWDYARWNQLIWTESGYNFMIQTNMTSDLLPLDELLKIADGLTQ